MAQPPRRTGFGFAAVLLLSLGVTASLGLQFQVPKENFGSAKLQETVPAWGDSVCTKDYAEWQGGPGAEIDHQDQWQCTQGRVSFVHIPKTAGTTLENLAKAHGLTWGHDYDWRRVDEVKRLTAEGNEDKLGRLHSIGTASDELTTCRTGCPCGTGCCWWHIPPRFLLDWRPYYKHVVKFCVVRNPFSRLLSQYSWKTGGKCVDTPEKAKERDDVLRRELMMAATSPGRINYGDCHYLPQHWYVADHVDKRWMDEVWGKGNMHAAKPPATMSLANAQSCNFVVRFEHLSEDLSVLGEFAEAPWLTSVNKNHVPSSSKCSKTLSQETVDLVRQVYAEDFQRFGYDQEWPVETWY